LAYKSTVKDLKKDIKLASDIENAGLSAGQPAFKIVFEDLTGSPRDHIASEAGLSCSPSLRPTEVDDGFKDNHLRSAQIYLKVTGIQSMTRNDTRSGLPYPSVAIPLHSSIGPIPGPEWN
jgi:hypothetical protein